MPQPGYQAGSAPRLWWKVAMHLDEAQLALVNALAHNVDDPTAALAVQDLLREAQTGLLMIFMEKGILPPSLREVGARPPAAAMVAPVAQVPVADVVAPVAQVPVADAMDEPVAAAKAEAYEAALEVPR